MDEEDATGDSSGLAETAKALHTWRGFAAERAALSGAATHWYSTTMGEEPKPPVPFVREDSWRLDDAIHDWMSEQSTAVTLPIAKSFDQQPRSPERSDKVLHDLYETLQRQQAQEQQRASSLGASVRAALVEEGAQRFEYSAHGSPLPPQSQLQPPPTSATRRSPARPLFPRELPSAPTAGGWPSQSAACPTPPPQLHGGHVVGYPSCPATPPPPPLVPPQPQPQPPRAGGGSLSASRPAYCCGSAERVAPSTAASTYYRPTSCHRAPPLPPHTHHHQHHHQQQQQQHHPPLTYHLPRGAGMPLRLQPAQARRVQRLLAAWCEHALDEASRRAEVATAHADRLARRRALGALRASAPHARHASRLRGSSRRHQRHAAFRAWRTLAARRARLRACAAAVVRLMRPRTRLAALRRWRRHAQHLLTAAVRVWRRVCAARFAASFRWWRARDAAARRRRHVGGTHVRRWAAVAVLRAFNGLVAHGAACRATRAKLRRGLFSSAHRGLRRAFNGWGDAAAAAAARRHAMLVVVSRLRHGRTCRALNSWADGAAEARRLAGVGRRALARLVHARAAAAMRSWCDGAALRGGARCLLRRALCRELTWAVRCWRELAGARRRRLRLMRAAVQRYRRAAEVEAIRGWAHAASRVRKLRALLARSLRGALTGAVVSWKLVARRARRRPAPPGAAALARLRQPGVAKACEWWRRVANEGARKRRLARRVVAALLHRHAAPALRFWAHTTQRASGRRAAVTRALLTLRSAALARGWRTLVDACDEARERRQTARAAVARMRRRGEAAALGAWVETARALRWRLDAMRRSVAFLTDSAVARALATWRGEAAERAAADTRRRRVADALRGGRLRYLVRWRAAAAERSALLLPARRAAARLVGRDLGRAWESWAEAAEAWARLRRCSPRGAQLRRAWCAWGEAAAAWRLLRRAAMRLRSSSLARAMTQLGGAAAEAAATRSRLTRVVAAAVLRGQARALRTWLGWRDERAGALARLRRSVLWLTHVEAARGLRAWRDTASEAREAATLLLRGAVRFRGAATAPALATLRAEAARRAALRAAATEAAARMLRRWDIAAFRLWRTHAARRWVLLSRLRRAVALFRGVASARALRTWQQLAEARADARGRIVRALGGWRSQARGRCYRSWRDAAAEGLRLTALVRGAAAALRASHLARALRSWAHATGYARQLLVAADATAATARATSPLARAWDAWAVTSRGVAMARRAARRREEAALAAWLEMRALRRAALAVLARARLSGKRGALARWHAARGGLAARLAAARRGSSLGRAALLSRAVAALARWCVAMRRVATAVARARHGGLWRALNGWRHAGAMLRVVRGALLRRLPLDMRRAAAAWHGWARYRKRRRMTSDGFALQTALGRLQAAVRAAAARTRQRGVVSLLRRRCDQHAIASSASVALRRWRRFVTEHSAAAALLHLAPAGRAERRALRVWAPRARARALEAQLRTLSVALFRRHALADATREWRQLGAERAAVKAAALHWRHAGVGRCWRQLRHLAAAWRTMRRAMLLLRGQRAARAVRSWAEAAEEARRQTSMLGRALASLRRGGEARALRAWRGVAEDRAAATTRLRSIVSTLRGGARRRALRGWRGVMRRAADAARRRARWSSPVEAARAAVCGRSLREALLTWWRAARLAVAIGGAGARRRGALLRGPFAALTHNAQRRRLAARAVRRLRSLGVARAHAAWRGAAAEAREAREAVRRAAERWRRAMRIDVLGAFRELRCAAEAAQSSADVARRHRRGVMVARLRGAFASLVAGASWRRAVRRGLGALMRRRERLALTTWVAAASSRARLLRKMRGAAASLSGSTLPRALRSWRAVCAAARPARRMARRMLRQNVVRALGAWREGAEERGRELRLLARAAPRGRVLGAAWRTWRGAGGGESLRLARRGAQLRRGAGLGAAWRTWAPAAALYRKRRQQGARVFKAGAARALCAWRALGRRWRQARAVCRRILCAGAVRALGSWRAQTAATQRCRRMARRALNQGAVGALGHWSAITAQVKATRALLGDGASSHRRRALRSLRDAAADRAARQARLARAVQLEKTLALVFWRREAHARAERLRRLRGACTRLVGDATARALASWRSETAARRARRAWLFGLGVGSSRKRALRAWAERAAARIRTLAILRRSVAFLTGSAVARALATWRGEAAERAAADTRRRRVADALRGGRLRYLMRWRAAAEQRSETLLLLQRAVMRLVCADLGRAWESWAEAAVAWARLRRFSPRGAQLRRAWCAWGEATATRVLAILAARRLCSASVARALRTWLGWCDERARALRIVLRAVSRITRGQEVRAFTAWAAAADEGSHRLRLLRNGAARLRLREAAALLATWRDTARVLGARLRLARRAVLSLLHQKQRRALAAWGEHRAATARTLALLRRTCLALLHRRARFAFRGWCDAADEANAALRRLLTYASRLARRALWLSLCAWRRRCRAECSGAEYERRTMTRVLLHWLNAAMAAAFAKLAAVARPVASARRLLRRVAYGRVGAAWRTWLAFAAARLSRLIVLRSAATALCLREARAALHTLRARARLRLRAHRALMCLRHLASARALRTWRGATAAMRGAAPIVQRSLHRWLNTALVAAFARLARHAAVARRLRGCAMSWRHAPAARALRRWRELSAAAGVAVQRLRRAVGCWAARGVAAALATWVDRTVAAVAARARASGALYRWSDAALGRALATWCEVALGVQRALGRLVAGAVARWRAGELAAATEAWKEATVWRVAALWRLHQSLVAWQQMSAVAALAALWCHAAARRRLLGRLGRAVAHLANRDAGRCLLTWRDAAAAQTEVAGRRRRLAAAVGPRGPEAKAMRAWSDLAARRLGARRAAYRALGALRLGRATRAWSTWAAATAARRAARDTAAAAAAMFARVREARGVRSWRDGADRVADARVTWQGHVARSGPAGGVRLASSLRLWADDAEEGRQRALLRHSGKLAFAALGVAAALRRWRSHTGRRRSLLRLGASDSEAAVAARCRLALAMHGWRRRTAVRRLLSLRHVRAAAYSGSGLLGLALLRWRALCLHARFVGALRAAGDTRGARARLSRCCRLWRANARRLGGGARRRVLLAEAARRRAASGFQAWRWRAGAARNGRRSAAEHARRATPAARAARRATVCGALERWRQRAGAARTLMRTAARRWRSGKQAAALGKLLVHAATAMRLHQCLVAMLNRHVRRALAAWADAGGARRRRLAFWHGASASLARHALPRALRRWMEAVGAWRALRRSAARLRRHPSLGAFAQWHRRAAAGADVGRRARRSAAMALHADAVCALYQWARRARRARRQRVMHHRALAHTTAAALGKWRALLAQNMRRVAALLLIGGPMRLVAHCWRLWAADAFLFGPLAGSRERMRVRRASLARLRAALGMWAEFSVLAVARPLARLALIALRQGAFARGLRRWRAVARERRAEAVHGRGLRQWRASERERRAFWRWVAAVNEQRVGARLALGLTSDDALHRPGWRLRSMRRALQRLALTTRWAALPRIAAFAARLAPLTRGFGVWQRQRLRRLLFAQRRLGVACNLELRGFEAGQGMTDEWANTVVRVQAARHAAASHRKLHALCGLVDETRRLRHYALRWRDAASHATGAVGRRHHRMLHAALAWRGAALARALAAWLRGCGGHDALARGAASSRRGQRRRGGATSFLEAASCQAALVRWRARARRALLGAMARAVAVGHDGLRARRRAFARWRARSRASSLARFGARHHRTRVAGAALRRWAYKTVALAARQRGQTPPTAGVRRRSAAEFHLDLGASGWYGAEGRG